PVGQAPRSREPGEGEGHGLAEARGEGVHRAGRRVHRDPLQPLMRGHASAMGSRRGARARAAVLVSGLALACMAAPAGAEGRLQKFHGHLGVGYAKLVGDPAPGGSFTMNAGVDYPVGERLRVGLDFGYELLGGDIVERGSFVAGVDYSMVELLALVHFAPQRLGPLRRISVGPGLFAPHGDLSVSAGGASFSDLAVDEVVPGAAL